MKKRYAVMNASAILALGVALVPATALAATAKTGYTHPGVSIKITPATTNYTHPNVVIQNAPRHPVAPGTGLAQGKSKDVLNYGWAASNWSGYAITGSTYNDITDNWIVPSVTSTSRNAYSSTWIGIDGYNNSDLIQTGTEQDVVNGRARYDAWWEILPAAETVIPNMIVSPGDHMYAHIHNNGNGTWTITLKDQTRGENFSTTQNYSGPATSAEWIQEAPEVNGQISKLANYGETTMDPGTVNGGNPRLSSADAGYMVQNNVQVSTPSNPDSDTDGFNVAYGSAQPAAPQS